MSLTKPGSNPKIPFKLVKDDMKKVEAEIRNQVQAFDPQVEPGATGGVQEGHRKIGMILELIHMSTLVHDDIIDGADTRRQVPTANAKWGNGMAVLLGDSLFSHSLLLATEFDDIHICRKVGKASREVCQGEVISIWRSGRSRSEALRLRHEARHRLSDL